VVALPRSLGRRPKMVKWWDVPLNDSLNVAGKILSDESWRWTDTYQK